MWLRGRFGTNNKEGSTRREHWRGFRKSWVRVDEGPNLAGAGVREFQPCTRFELIGVEKPGGAALVEEEHLILLGL